MLCGDEAQHHWYLTAADEDSAEIEHAEVVKELNQRGGGERPRKVTTRLTVDQWLPEFLTMRAAARPDRDPDQAKAEHRFLRDIALSRFQIESLRGLGGACVTGLRFG